MAKMLGWSHNFLMEEISKEEYDGWCDYFSRQPDGWRDDLRAYYVMSSMGGTKVEAEKIFPSIAQLKQYEAEAELRKTEEEKKLEEQRALRRSLAVSPFAAKMGHLFK